MVQGVLVLAICLIEHYLLPYIFGGKIILCRLICCNISSYPVLKHLPVGICMQYIMNKCQKKKSYKNLLCVVKEDVSSHGASMLHHGCVFLAVLHVGVCY